MIAKFSDLKLEHTTMNHAEKEAYIEYTKYISSLNISPNS